MHHPTANAGIGRLLLELAPLSPASIRALLTRARAFAEAPAAERFDSLTGQTVANLFFEDSTRTRLSFTFAARRLGGDVVVVQAKGSSVSKGETVADTARTVESMGVSVIVIRHAASGAAKLAADAVQCMVISAGDGRHAHPTQGLLDAYVVAEAHGRLEDFNLQGIRVGIVGDLSNSRVVRSDIQAFTKLGAEVVCVGPARLAPPSLRTPGCSVSHDLDEVLPTLDAVQMLRIQIERGASIGSAREYIARFQLNDDRAARLRPGAVILHPGPMNRGFEIVSSVADGSRSRIRRQVEVGVPVRMAALECGRIAT